jgi:DNA repair protein RadC
LAHNHPSGDPTPSREDIEITRKLVETGNIMGISVLDHVIIGDGRNFSMKEAGHI